LSLLLAFGPIASLGGIFLGEVVVVARCAALVAGWKKTLPAPAQACRPGGVYAHA
jgi:hypothetical protein